MIHLKIDIPPKGKMSVRNTRSGISYTHPDQRAWFNEFSILFLKEISKVQHRTYSGGIAIITAHYIKKPKSSKLDEPIVKPDLDNLTKSLWDGINKTGKIWLDDKQVISNFTTKRYTDSNPYIEIIITESKDFMHGFNIIFGENK